MKQISILIVLLLCGCTVDRWTEKTNEVRPVGEPIVSIENRGLAHHALDYQTDLERDGFRIKGRATTDEDGRAIIPLLPVALQSIYYGHEVTLRAVHAETGKHALTHEVDEQQARHLVSEAMVGARLGGKVKLRKPLIQLLDVLLETGLDNEMRDWLETIRGQVVELPPWRE